MKSLPTTRRPSARRRNRLGAILSMELILVLPIVIGLLLAMIEMGMLWSAGQRIDEAASGGCRIASFRGADLSAVRRHVEHSLRRKTLVQNYALDVRTPDENPDQICVTVSVPMKSAAPDLLTFLGFSLGDRRITAQAIMRKE